MYKLDNRHFRGFFCNTPSRPGWDELISYIRPGDTLVITELSRMSRSFVHLFEIVQKLEERNFFHVPKSLCTIETILTGKQLLGRIVAMLVKLVTRFSLQSEIYEDSEEYGRLIEDEDGDE